MDFDIMLLIVFVTVLFYFCFYSRPANYPPGPLKVPILGNLLQIGDRPYLKCQNEWKEKYGPIISVTFGSYEAIIISDARISKKVYLDPKFAGRPNMLFVLERSRSKSAKGIIFTHGEVHAEQRKSTIKYLKESGFGKSTHDAIILGQARDCLEHLEREGSNPVILKNFFHSYIVKILWPMIAGEDAGEHDTLTEIFKRSTEIQEETLKFSALCMFIPWFAKYFPNLSGYNVMNSQLKHLFKFLKKYINQHKIQYENEPGVFNDVIGAYIHEMKTTTNPLSSFYGDAGEKNLMSVLLDLFFAGTETTGLTLSWGLLYLAKFPEVQEKAHEEIHRVLQGKLPSSSDEQSMIYMQAIVQETLRLSSIIPLGIFHSAMEDVELEGFIIPKDTLAFINIHGAHHDKDYWGDPEVFRPERFISSDGQLVKHENFFPFGLGKRLCIGELLARKEIFLFLTCILQKFRITPHESNPDPSTEPVVSFTLAPQSYKFVFSNRD